MIGMAARFPIYDPALHTPPKRVGSVQWQEKWSDLETDTERTKINTECFDVRVRDDDGKIIYAGPRFLRCQRIDCGALVTHGMIQELGSCMCGSRRVRAAVNVMPEEESALQELRLPMLPWERECMYVRETKA